jgi:hypothetical protein
VPKLPQTIFNGGRQGGSGGSIPERDTKSLSVEEFVDYLNKL